MTGSRRRIALEVAATLCFAAAVLCVATLAFLRWLVHGDYERTIWVISGPGVFGQMGGGPFQLWLGAGLLLLVLSSVSAGAALRGPSRPGAGTAGRASRAASPRRRRLPGAFGVFAMLA